MCNFSVYMCAYIYLCVCVCVSSCGCQPELSGKLLCLFPIDVTEMECSQN